MLVLCYSSADPALEISYLSIPGHAEADEPLVEGRRVGFGDVEGLVLEQVLVHLVGHGHRRALAYLFPFRQVGGFLIEFVNCLKDYICF